MIGIYVLARIRNLPAQPWPGFAEVGAACLSALGGLMLIVIVLGSIYGGIASPTEAAAVSAVYAFLIAVFGWVAISAASTMPFLIHGSISSFTDAFFEMMSGYTTTGATILTDIEALPRGLLLWRSETHLLGGMGFLTLAILFLPHGVGGMRMFRAESSPGQVITKERFTARNRDAIWYLWIIYLVLNLAQIVLLMLGGMSLETRLEHCGGDTWRIAEDETLMRSRG